MKRSVLWIGVMTSLALGVVFVLDFQVSTLLLFAAAAVVCLFAFSREMFDTRYHQIGGTGHVETVGFQPQCRDIGHLPGRAHQTFASAARLLAVGSGQLQLLPRRRVSVSV